MAVVSRGSDGLALEPPAGYMQPGLVTQISHRHSPGRAYYQRKLTEGKTPKEALRSLKRRLSDVIFAHLQADARRAAAEPR